MSLLLIPNRSQLNRRRTYFAFSFIAGESGQYVSGAFDADRRSDTATARHAAPLSSLIVVSDLPEAAALRSLLVQFHDTSPY